MSEPRSQIVRRLTAGRSDTRFETLAGDASARRFVRVIRGSGTTIAMDYGEPFRGESRDQRLAALFLAAGLPVAHVLEAYPEDGFIVIEDLGSTMLEEVLRSADPGGPPPRTWLDAVRLAAQVADRGTPVLQASDRAAGPALDSERFRYEMDFFLEHFAGGLRGIDPPEALREALHRLADDAADSPRNVLCHRDYHCRNLMVRDDGSLAMVDIQDARWGPDSYDLASLVRDAYVDISEDWVQHAVAHYVDSLVVPPADGFRRRLDRVSAQRMIKALGTFGFQKTRRNSERYLEPIPRTIDRLRALLPGLVGHERLHALLEDQGLLSTEL